MVIDYFKKIRNSWLWQTLKDDFRNVPLYEKMLWVIMVVLIIYLIFNY